MKKAYNIIILLMIIGIVLSSCLLIFNSNSKCKSKTKVIQTKKVVEKEKKIDWKQENIVFLGDSITEIYPIDEVFGELPVVKSGVSGYKTTDILERMDSMVYQYNPTKVFLLIGTNDFMFNVDTEMEDEVLKNIKEIVSDIQQNRKDTKVYIESIFPVNRTMNLTMILERNNETIMNTNSKIKEYCNGKNITYIDMYKELIDNDGNFDEKYTYDGLHPNTLGYAKISHILTKYIYDVEK